MTRPLRNAGRARAARSHRGRPLRGRVRRSVRDRAAEYIGTSFLFVLPVVLAALWFGVRGSLVVSLSAAVCFFIVERLDPSVDVELHTVVWAALARAGGLVLAGVLIAVLLERQVVMRRELEELEATRDALRPSAIAPRPALDIASHYLPAQDGAGGDFFVAVEGPRGSTVLVVGDVVGKKLSSFFLRIPLMKFIEGEPIKPATNCYWRVHCINAKAYQFA